MDTSSSPSPARPNHLRASYQLTEAARYYTMAWASHEETRSVPCWVPEGEAALRRAVEALGYSLTPISPDTATGKDGGNSESDAPLGGGESSPQSPVSSPAVEEVAS